jgi:hypothetical protein
MTPRHQCATVLDEGSHGVETHQRAPLHATLPLTHRLDSTQEEYHQKGPTSSSDAFNKENGTHMRGCHRAFTRNHRKEVQHHDHAPNNAKRCQIAPS